jgi:fumarate reductase subunit C
MHAEGTATVYHPRLSGNWWTRNQHYLLYMVRELTAVFDAAWAVIFIVQIPAMAGGADAHGRWLAMVNSPAWVIFSLISLAFVLYHAYTAFTATNTLLYIRMGPKPVPGNSLNALMFVGFTVVTVVLAFILVTPTIGG